ncbi:MAG TPA: tetratricopeptide repeat-containing glycosyltransferase family protein [Rhizomicrobium sp.]|nr:tetratricopeptide repeat-containing glycosyltransferase family protein [Rhizomicrobium sp.]
MAEAAQRQRVRKTVDQWRAEAVAFEKAGRLEDAEALLAKIIEAKPNYHPVIHQAAILSWKRKRPKESLQRFARALELSPQEPMYHRNICEVLRSQGRLDEALAHGVRAVELSPQDAGSHYNVGVIRYDRLEIEEGIAAIRRALELDPASASAHFELAEALLLTGQFKEGWEEYEWRFDLPSAPPLLPPNDKVLWDGKPMPNGTLMLIGDQGFGDTIQFCRYIPMAAERCPRILMAASKEMQPIVMQQKGITEYYDRWEQMPAFDAYCSLSGLPKLFGTDLNNIPAPVPYVKADPAKAEHWRKKLDALTPPGYRRMGLVWAGRPTHGNDFNRSTSLRQLAPLMAQPNIAFVSLQKGDGQNQIGSYFGTAPLINFGAEIEDFTDTMGILDNLDRLVTVDTGVAHLAGAMGRPVSILVPFAPDWRWLLSRSDTPWYPTIALHRQDRPGDWDSAIAKAIALIRA